MSERHTHASAHGRPKWPVRAMVTCALLTAVSVVLARFLIPTPNEVTRFSLEAVPIFLAGMLFGPLPGAGGDLLSRIPFLSVGIPAVFSLYFDWFSSFMQAFIFCMLTMLYIANAAESDG